MSMRTPRHPHVAIKAVEQIQAIWELFHVKSLAGEYPNFQGRVRTLHADHSLSADIP